LAALKRQYWRPASIPYPKENPYGRAKEELGRALFFDPILSGARGAILRQLS
jgi:cytochrome c peroxidase